MSLTEAHAVRYFLLTSTTVTPWKSYMEMFIVVVTQQWLHHAVSRSSPGRLDHIRILIRKMCYGLLELSRNVRFRPKRHWCMLLHLHAWYDSRWDSHQNWIHIENILIDEDPGADSFSSNICSEQIQWLGLSCERSYVHMNMHDIGSK